MSFFCCAKNIRCRSLYKYVNLVHNIKVQRRKKLQCFAHFLKNARTRAQQLAKHSVVPLSKATKADRLDVTILVAKQILEIRKVGHKASYDAIKKVKIWAMNVYPWMTDGILQHRCLCLQKQAENNVLTGASSNGLPYGLEESVEKTIGHPNVSNQCEKISLDSRKRKAIVAVSEEYMILKKG